VQFFIADQRITSLEGMLSVLKWQLYGFWIKSE